MKRFYTTANVMPVITKITQQKSRPTRRNIFLDGRFAFGCGDVTVARYRLQPGLELSHEQTREIEFGEVKAECFNSATQLLAQRLHSRAELFRKLRRHEWGDGVVEAVIDDLTHMGYVDDARFAVAKAESAAKHKQHGRKRAFLELIRCGVKGDVAEKALNEVYKENDPALIARELAMKQAPRLKQLAPDVARRRLAGMLQRRGFEYEAIRPVIDEALGTRRAYHDAAD